MFLAKLPARRRQGPQHPCAESRLKRLDSTLQEGKTGLELCKGEHTSTELGSGLAFRSLEGVQGWRTAAREERTLLERQRHLLDDLVLLSLVILTVVDLGVCRCVLFGLVCCHRVAGKGGVRGSGVWMGRQGEEMRRPRWRRPPNARSTP